MQSMSRFASVVSEPFSELSTTTVLQLSTEVFTERIATGEGSGNVQVEDWSSRNLERTANVGSGAAVASR